MSWEKPNEGFSFVPFPRQIKNFILERKINQSEILIYAWIRINSDVNGKTWTSITSITYDIFGKKDKKTQNLVNKILLNLKKKRIIYFEKRQGNRHGTFPIFNDEIILSKSKLTSIEPLFLQENTISSQKSDTSIQKFDGASMLINKTNSEGSERSEFRSPYNENDIEKENEIKHMGSAAKSLTPEEHTLCSKIGNELGEMSVGFLQMLLPQYGHRRIENAFEQYRRDKEGGKIIQNHHEYFIALVTGKNRKI